jgi:hypothetical protein
MPSDKELKFIVTAVDNATKELKKVSDSLNTFSKDSAKVATGQENMAKSVFTGMVSFAALSKALSTVSTFMKSSINDAIKAETTWAGLGIVLENVGDNLSTAMPQIEEFAKKMEGFGIDAEDTAQSINILRTSAESVAGAINLSGLAMELATRNYMTGKTATVDLNGATNQLVKMINGGSGVAKQFGIDIKEVATKEEMLSELTTILSGNVEKFSNTTEGATQRMVVAWNNVKKEIGKNFIPAVQEGQQALDLLSKDNSLSNFVKKSTKLLGDFAKSMIQGGMIAFAFIVDMVKNVWDVIRGVGEAIGKVLYDIFTGNFKDIKKDIADSFNVGAGAFDTIKSVWNNLVMDTESGNEKIKAGLESAYGVNGALGKGGEEVTKLNEKFGDLKTKILDTAQGGVDALSEVSKKILDIQQSISNLDVAHATEGLGVKKDFATAFVDQEKKIEEMKLQVSNEADYAKRAKLQAQLLVEQEALAQRKNIETAYATEINEVRRRNALTEFERTVEDLNQKQLAMDQEYQMKKSKLEDELKLEMAKQDKLKAIMDIANLESQKFLLEGQKQSVDSINKEIAYWNQLAQAIARAKSGATSGNVSFGGAGQITGLTSQIATAKAGLTSEITLPDKATEKGATIVNVNGGNYLDKEAAMKLGNYLGDFLPKGS